MVLADRPPDNGKRPGQWVPAASYFDARTAVGDFGSWEKHRNCVFKLVVEQITFEVSYGDSRLKSSMFAHPESG